AARKLNEGQNIYRPPFINGLQYYYSVFFALLLVPFSTTVFITEIFWSLLSYFLLYRTLILIETYFDFSELSKTQYRIWLLLTSILSVQFILYNVTLIQVTFFLLWAIFESINLLFKGKNVLGGLLLGLAINIKLMPVLLLPYLFYRGYFKALFFTIITFIALLFLPSLFIGNNYNQFLLSEWWTIINPGNTEHMFETGIGTHSLVALIPVYLTETAGDMAYKRNILNLNHQNTEIIINIVRLFIFSLSLLYLRSFPFKRENNKLKSFWEISYFVLMIPLLLPHQQKYAFILAIPMVSYLIYFFITTIHYQKTGGYYFALFLFVVSMLFYSPLYGTDVIGKFLFYFTQHYRFLTFSTLLIIPISLYCSPGRLQSIKK
ncbi:MAG TPA: glycosyltransferase family 87 protein, partial [Chitinophagaceae bacterium]|nr:glycosyltransferase family 87 protein [Chitinophagaceae bacterium]